MISKPDPFVEITCEVCGCIAAGSGYYYNGIIAKIRESTKNWKHCNGITYCESCWQAYLEDIEQENEK